MGVDPVLRSLAQYLLIAAGIAAALGWAAAFRSGGAASRLVRGAALVALAAFFLGCGLAYLPAVLEPQGDTSGPPQEAAAPDEAGSPGSANGGAPGASPGTSGEAGLGEVAPGNLGHEFEFEITFQPPLPPALAEAMAQAEAETAQRHPLDGQSLGSGDVVIESVDPQAEWVVLHNRSGYAVDLGGWSLFAEAAGGWCHLPDGLVVPAGGRVTVLSGPAVAASGLVTGQLSPARDRYAWTEADVITVPAKAAGTGLVLYDGQGNVRSRR